MTLSVFYAHILDAAAHHNLPLSDLLSRVRQMGYTMVEIDVDALNEDSFSLLQSAGMGISSIYCFFHFDSDPQTERISALIDSAIRFGAKRIMPIPGLFHAETAAGREIELERMLAGMQELTSLAQKKGLTVTIEDFGEPASPIRDSRGMSYFLDRLPALSATFDTGNFRICGENEVTAFDALKSRIAHVHLKDRSLSCEYGSSALTTMDGTIFYPCPVGSGILPMETIFDLLCSIDYQGVLSVEHFGVQDQLSCMEKSADFVRRCIKCL